MQYLLTKPSLDYDTFASLYEKYYFISRPDQKEQEIVAKEKEVTDIKYKYFGPQGELFKKRESLIKPIQDDVYNAVKKVSEERGYQAIFDRASSQSIIFASPRIDVSNLVLEKLGYAK